MVVWLNGAFGAGKTSTAFELARRLPGSFVFDPENVGYFIRKNTPSVFSEGDFQDFPLWRKINAGLLELILSRFDGTLIVPMTVADPQVFRELVGRLREDGADVRHFILTASRETVLRRIRKRSLGRRDAFAEGNLDRCLAAFTGSIPGEAVETDSLSICEAAEEVAARCGLELAGRGTALGRFLYRARVVWRHIR